MATTTTCEPAPRELNQSKNLSETIDEGSQHRGQQATNTLHGITKGYLKLRKRASSGSNLFSSTTPSLFHLGKDAVLLFISRKGGHQLLVKLQASTRENTKGFRGASSVLPKHERSLQQQGLQRIPMSCIAATTRLTFSRNLASSQYHCLKFLRGNVINVGGLLPLIGIVLHLSSVSCSTD